MLHKTARFRKYLRKKKRLRKMTAFKVSSEKFRKVILKKGDKEHFIYACL